MHMLMRLGDPLAPAWPPHRSTTRRVSLRVLALYNLPTRREARPLLRGGAHAAAMQHVSELNGAPPSDLV
jgi:hypothetical protein